MQYHAAGSIDWKGNTSEQKEVHESMDQQLVAQIDRSLDLFEGRTVVVPEHL